MIFAYVSDENYLALPGVFAECVRVGDGECVEVRSSASGALRAELNSGRYRITLAKDGYGAKWGEYDLPTAAPLQLRMMSHTPCGYMWPKWVKAGDESEIKAHAHEQYQLSLWRYGQHKESVGVLSWFDEHAPLATEQLLPDGDITESGVQWNTVGYPSVHPQQRVAAPTRSGLYYIWGRTLSGKRFSFPWVVAPAKPQSKIAVLANTNTWNAYNAFGGRS
ncbi:MAG: N,N-dimethylformamidase beta subunit family domain-containing protein, partial [Bryocella sp.]